MDRAVRESVDFTAKTFLFIRESFGRVFRSKRLKAGLTQEDISKNSGLRVETISRIESGKGNPTMETLLRLMRSVE